MISKVLLIEKRLIRKHLLRFTKFAKVGLFVTLLSLALSFFFLKIIGTPLIGTYIILYLSMIILSFLLNAKYTFQSSYNIKKLFLYYGSYGISMLLGVLLLSIFKKILPFENWVLAYLVIPFTMTSNFLLSSFIFKNKHA